MQLFLNLIGYYYYKIFTFSYKWGKQCEHDNIPSKCKKEDIILVAYTGTKDSSIKFGALSTSHTRGTRETRYLLASLLTGKKWDHDHVFKRQN